MLLSSPSTGSSNPLSSLTALWSYMLPALHHILRSIDNDAEKIQTLLIAMDYYMGIHAHCYNYMSFQSPSAAGLNKSQLTRRPLHNFKPSLLLTPTPNYHFFNPTSPAQPSFCPSPSALFSPTRTSTSSKAASSAASLSIEFPSALVGITVILNFFLFAHASRAEAAVVPAVSIPLTDGTSSPPLRLPFASARSKKFVPGATDAQSRLVMVQTIRLCSKVGQRIWYKDHIRNCRIRKI